MIGFAEGEFNCKPLKAACMMQRHDSALLKRTVSLIYHSFSTATLARLRSHTHGSKVITLEFNLKLKIKRNDCLLADTCPQAVNFCALF